jgi:hypothetical protein
MTENEKDAWENLKESIMIIEEEETGLKWESTGRELWKVIIRGKLNKEKESESGGREDPNVDEEGGERKSVKSVKEMIKNITSQQAIPEVKEMDKSVKGAATKATSEVKVKVPTIKQLKREVSMSAIIKEKSRVWESKEPVKEMARKFDMKKVSQAKHGKEMFGSDDGEKRGVKKRSRMVSGQSVSELSRRWEGSSTTREN